MASTVLSAGLLFLLYRQVSAQLHGVERSAWRQTHSVAYLVGALLLLPLNLGLEALKWRLLAQTAGAISYRQAAASYLAGIAASLVTPNRIGEYPGRILYLRREASFRLVSAAVLGALAQMLALLAWGALGLGYFLAAHPQWWVAAVLGACLLGIAGVSVVYFRFERWLPRMARARWLRRFVSYSQLAGRFGRRWQWGILALSVGKFAVFTAQYVLMLRWTAVPVPALDGFCLAALFFWTMAVIPTVTLAEVGIRGQVGLYLFAPFSTNTIGILAATLGLWLMNLALPSTAGALLWLRVRIFRDKDSGGKIDKRPKPGDYGEAAEFSTGPVKSARE